MSTNAAIETESKQLTTSKENPSPAVIHEQGPAAVLSLIGRAASDPSVDIDKMERLMNMHKSMVDREAEQQFWSDFALMQAELPEINESGKIVVKGNVQSTYAKFEDINDACKPILKQYGFGISFRVLNKGIVTVTGILAHKSGHREETTLELNADTTGNKNIVQSTGSSISYGKRYVMEAMLNITTRGQDDDGQTAIQAGGDKRGAKLKDATLNQAQLANVKNAIKMAGISENDFCQLAQIESVNLLSPKRLTGALARLNQIANRAK